MSTFIWIILSIVFGLLYSLVHTLPGHSKSIFVDIFWFLFLFSGSIFISRFLSYLITDVIFSKFKGKSSSDLLRFIIIFFLYTTFLALIFKYALGWNLTAFLTTSALLTAVVGFALQTTLGNLFAGVAIQIEQSFYIGDVVKINDTFGRVETLRWRSMSIRTFDGTLLVIPNNQISTETVEVFPSKEPVRVSMKLPIPTNISPEIISSLIRKVILATPNVYTELQPFIRIDSYDPRNGIIWYQVRYFVENYLVEHIVDAAVKERIWYVFNRHKINVSLSNIFEHDFVLPKTSSANMPYPNISKETIKECVAKINEYVCFKNPEKIASKVNVYAYAKGEPILYTEKKHDAIYFIYKGIVKVRQQTPQSIDCMEKHTNIKTEYLEFWPSEILNNVNKQLTVYIGPISEHKVKEAAKKTLDTRHLYSLLSNHILNEKHKTDFLSYAPDETFQFFLKDSWLNLADISENDAFSQGETILLEVPVSI